MILIKNAKIIDGVNAPERRGDVLISGKSISAIGNFPYKKTEIVIEALGHRLVPGFINIRVESSNATDILTDPAQYGARAEGFTTLIGGMDGVSLAPIMQGTLAPLRKWAGAETININWRGIAEFQKTLCRLSLGVNFYTFAGYNTIRRDITHETGGDPTDKELNIIIGIAEEAMQEGAVGIAVNLNTAHGKRISHEEVRRAAIACAHAGKPFALRLRAQTEHFMEAANEAITIYQKAGARMILIDFLPKQLSRTEEKDFHLAYTALTNAGDGLYMELYLGENRLMPLYELLPRFAQEGTLETMHALIRDKSQQKKLLAGLPRLENARIVRAPREHAHLVNITLETFAHNHDMTAKEALLELMRITKLRATLAIPHAPSSLHAELIKNNRVLASGSPRAVFKIADNARLPLETAVMKMSGLPASVVGLKKRGIIRENYAADLALMNDRNEVVRVIVNGTMYEKSDQGTNL